MGGLSAMDRTADVRCTSDDGRGNPTWCEAHQDGLGQRANKACAVAAATRTLQSCERQRTDAILHLVHCLNAQNSCYNKKESTLARMSQGFDMVTKK